MTASRSILLAAALLSALAVWLAWPAQQADARDYDCSDFSTQAEAQRWLLPGDPHRLDSDGDGVACESLPRGSSGGGGAAKPKAPSSSCRRPGRTVRIKLSKRKHRTVKRHIRRAVKRGWPRVLRIHRRGADRRRSKLLQRYPTRRGFDRDEWPMAMARRGWRADVMYVPSGENRSAGAIVGNALRGLCNGVRFTVVFR